MTVNAEKVILATGAYEETPSSFGLHGTNPAGVLTAGTAQYYINVLGQLPAMRAVILGSGNISLNLARRLSLEGAKDLGVYEPSSERKASPQIVMECLNDFDIPLHLNHTITRAFGVERLRAVEVFRTNKNGDLLQGTGVAVKCDGLFLSTNLISEANLAQSLGAEFCPNTNAPICDQNGMTSVDKLFTCGNSAFINTVSSLISKHGSIVGLGAAKYYPRERKSIKINASKNFLTFIPQHVGVHNNLGEITIFFRVNNNYINKTVRVIVNSVTLCSEVYTALSPQNTYCVTAKIETALTPDSKIELRLV
jgi:thioredoxin reductase